MSTEQKTRTGVMAAGTEPESGVEGPLLHDTVQALSHTIKDLEKQLQSMLAVNRALEKDLEAERKRATEIDRERLTHREAVQRLEREVSTLEDLRAELGHVSSERARLAVTIKELGRQLSDAEQEGRKNLRMSEKLRTERDDALEELQSVEAQFQRAMQMVEDMRARVVTLAQERDALVERQKVLEAELRSVEEQRDLLKAEVGDSQTALDEIRRGIADAMGGSQRHFQPGGGE